MTYGEKISIRINKERQKNLSLGNAIPVPIKDYEQLDNLPQINHHTLIGDMTASQLFSDGLILDGGTAQEVTA